MDSEEGNPGLLIKKGKYVIRDWECNIHYPGNYINKSLISLMFFSIMKNNVFLSLTFLCSCMALFPIQASSQCSWAHLWESDGDASTLVVNTRTSITSTIVHRGYVLINNPTIGRTYRIDLCGASVDTRLSQYVFDAGNTTSGSPDGGGGAGLAESTGGCTADATDPQLVITATSTDPLVIGVNLQNCSAGADFTNVELFITDLGVLPVSFGEISAKQMEGNVSLSWATFSEVNNLGFDVQRSMDGMNWNSIHFETSDGNSTTKREYEFLDPMASPGIRYYRLQQIDMDGGTSYSNTVNLQVENTGPSLNVFPNPATDQLTVVLLSDLDIADKATMKMFDITGRCVMEQELQTEDQLLRTDLGVKGVSPGVYIVQVSTGVQVTRERVIIQ